MHIEEPVKNYANEYARGFGRMFGAFVFIGLSVRAPLPFGGGRFDLDLLPDFVGYWLIASGAKRLLGLDERARSIRKLAIVLMVLALPDFVHYHMSIQVADQTYWFAPNYILTIPSAVLDMILVWKLCGLIGDVARQAGAAATARSARNRRVFYLFFRVVSLTPIGLLFFGPEVSVPVGFACLVLSVVVVCLLMGLMRQMKQLCQAEQMKSAAQAAKESSAIRLCLVVFGLLFIFPLNGRAGSCSTPTRSVSEEPRSGFGLVWCQITQGLSEKGTDPLFCQHNGQLAQVWARGLTPFRTASHTDLAATADDTQTSTWKTIAPFFQPPAEFANQFGAYRSPLLFADGTPVRSAEDWARRRKELLATWHEIMGPWPEVIAKPKVEVLSRSRGDKLTQERVRVEIAPKQSGEGWLLKPEGRGPFPAVLVVYYEPETSIGQNPKQPLRDFGLQLAKRGFVTLSIGTPGGDARKPDLGTAACQPLSFHAYVAANCWHALANLPEVDAKRIGVVGHSYGGKWAMFAAALWDKFAAVAVSDPGIVFDETKPNVNYWEPWYLGFDPKQKRPKPGLPTTDNPRTGAYKKMIETGRDLHELHALIAPRPFLVSGGSEDPPSRWIALNHALAVNNLLGYTNRVAMTNRKGHTPNEVSNAQLYAFFEHFLLNR